MARKTRPPLIIRIGAGLFLAVTGLLILATAFLIAMRQPIDEGREWSARVPLGTYAAAGFLRGGW